MKQQENNAKIHPSDENSHDQEDHDDSGNEMKESDIDRTKNEESNLTVVNKEEFDDNDGDQMDEQESRDKVIRMHLEKFLINWSGNLILKFIGGISVATSVMFVYLTYKTPAQIDPRCAEYDEKFEVAYNEYLNIHGQNATLALQEDIGLRWKDEILFDDNDPRCDEFYNSRMPLSFETVDLMAGFVYLIHYFLTIFISQNRCTYFISSESILELMIIIPIFIFRYNCTWVGLLFKALSRMVRLLKCEIFLKSDGASDESNVNEQIKKIAVELLIMLIVSSVLFMVLENFDPEKNPEPYQFQTCIYCMFVTLITVGYGDYFPKTDMGQMFTMVTIIYTIVYKIPMHMNELLRLMGLKSFYAREIYKSNNEVPHVVITGQVVIQALQNFSEELFHIDHGTQDRHAIILQPNDPSNEMEMFLHDPTYETCIRYINGNPMLNKDLERADVRNAKTCILLTNKNSKDANGMDHKNILIGLAMKKYVLDSKQMRSGGDPDMSLCLQLIKPESKQHYFSSINVHSNQDQIIIVEEIKMNMMSKSCFSPGIINFISNLISSTGDQGEMELTWLSQYAEGMGHEIYRIKLSKKMENRTFAEISGLVYMQNRSIVFAIEIKTNGKTIIRLNPSDFIVNNIDDNQIYVYTICEDKDAAQEIETLYMNKDEINKYYNAKALADKIAKEEEDMMEEDMDDDDVMQDDRGAKFQQSEGQIIDDIDTDLNNDGVDEHYQQETEDKKLMQDYYVWDSPTSSMSVTLASLENDPYVKNHIVVCGIHSAIKSFIMPLRAKYLKDIQLQKIVIITGEPDERGGDQIDSQIWNQISRFQYVFLVNGSPLKQETLHKANINYADKVVILGHDSTLNQEISDEMLDAESIYIYQAVKKVNKDVQILTELVYSSNIEFLLPIYPPNNDYHLSTLYAAGEVYISAIIDTLTCQSYFNPHIVTILQQILKGASEEDDEQLRDMMKAHPDLIQSNLWQIPVPEICVGKTFEFLFMNLLKKKLICMALYRLRGATDNNYPYVYTNPEKDTPIEHRDRAFVLGIEIPDELQGDIYEMVEREREVELGNPDNKNIATSSITGKHMGKSRQQQQQAQKQRSTNSVSALSKQKQAREEDDHEESKAGTVQSNPPAEDQEDVFLGVRSSKHQSHQVQTITRKLELSIQQIEGAISKINENVEKQNNIIVETTKQITQDYLNSYKDDFQERIANEKNL